MAYGNTVDGCQCVCDDTFGGADCSCAKSGTCLGATVFRARAANVAAVTTLACLGERVAGWDVWPRQACAVQPTSAPCTSTCTAKRGRRPHFPKSLASLATTDVSTTPKSTTPAATGTTIADGAVRTVNASRQPVSALNTAATLKVFYSGQWYPTCGHCFWDNNAGASEV